MRQVYTVLDKIKEILRANGITKTVTFGDITEVDLNKTSIFPLSHIIFGNVTFQDRIMSASIRILCLDVVDITKEKQTEHMMFGNDNLQDILNTQLQVVNELQQQKTNLKYQLPLASPLNASNIPRTSLSVGALLPEFAG